MKILITGARAPVALDLTRRFATAGHQVHVADSLPLPLAGFSRHCRAVHRLPPPRQQPEAFREALAALMKAEDFALLVPTCEEILWVASAGGDFQSRVFAPPLASLIRLHSKWSFNQWAESTPPSWYLESPGQALQLPYTPEELVFKPVFSRFGTQTLIRPARQVLARLPITTHQPWIAQRYLPGELLCSYSLAQAGRLAAHVTYLPRLRLHGGAGVVFESIRHRPIRTWVERFVAKHRLTGQLAFDFIESPDGGLAALECNPRATSGVHLFPDDNSLVDAFLGVQGECREPPPGRRAMLAMAALYCSPAKFLSWRARPVVCRRSDPLPGLGQLLSFLPLWVRSLRLGISILRATTYDIEWDQV